MSQSRLTDSEYSYLRSRLLRWFDRNRRELPWRLNRDPYRIWVSEVMLQQTTVATVISRFERFVQEFPTVDHLACATEQQVLRLWEGLGYYRRARDLHRAARILVEKRASSLPDDPEIWADLPGVGRYILGAVLSQAFDRRLPIVEANSKRVLCRLFGRLGDPSSGPATRWLWRTAEALLPPRRVGDFNQALMELGALICTPSTPRCDRCPVASVCAAKRAGMQERIPAKPAVPKIEEVREAAVVIRDRRRVLLVQRPATGRWANMWEFPHIPLAAGESAPAAAKRLLSAVLGLETELGDELLTIRHRVTRFRITMVCLQAKYRAGRLDRSYYKEGRWLEPAQLKDFPVSTPQRRLADELSRNGKSRRLL